jgi:hypothetical protein
VKYCPDDGLFRLKHLGNTVNTSVLINSVHLLVLHHCSLMNKTTGKTHKNLQTRNISGTVATKSKFSGKGLEVKCFSGIRNEIIFFSNSDFCFKNKLRAHICKKKKNIIRQSKSKY